MVLYVVDLDCYYKNSEGAVYPRCVKRTFLLQALNSDAAIKAAQVHACNTADQFKDWFSFEFRRCMALPQLPYEVQIAEGKLI